MNTFTPLFNQLFRQDPLPMKTVELVSLQLCCLHGQGVMWEAFKEAALEASPQTQRQLEDWLQNHWNQLSRRVALSDYETDILLALRQQLDAGTTVICGVADQGLQFIRSTETHAH